VEWRQNLLTKLWSQAESRPIYYTDLIFQCPDGSIQAHKVWLTNCCTTLGKALLNVHNCLEEFITVLVPDFSISIVRKFLKLFYTGSVELSDCIELEEIKEFGCRQLGLSMSLDQLKFERVASEKLKVQPPNLDRLQQIFGAKKPKPALKRGRLSLMSHSTPNGNQGFGNVSLQDQQNKEMFYSTPERSFIQNTSTTDQNKCKPKSKRIRSSAVDNQSQELSNVTYNQNLMVQITNDQVDDIEILEELPNSSFRELSNNQQVLSNNQFQHQPNETNQMATLDEMDDGGDDSAENEVENLSDDDDDNENNNESLEAELVGEPNGNKMKKRGPKKGFKMSIPTNILKKMLTQKSKKLSCSICSKTFVKEIRLEKHMRISHKNNNFKTEMNPHEEEVDQEMNHHPVGTTNDSLPQNESANNTDIARSSSFSCIECGKSFTTKAGLKIHFKNIHQATPSQCMMCPKSFKNDSTLKYHLKNIHKIPTEMNIFT
jgi:hypothetical protein